MDGLQLLNFELNSLEVFARILFSFPSADQQRLPAKFLLISSAGQTLLSTIIVYRTLP
jgi:hypothetical protein